ncbi:MAG TPA: rhodanese-like domain-containing protein [Sphingobacteriaceae bacterium]
MKAITFLFILLSFAPAAYAQSDKPILVEPKWLQEHLHDPDLVLLQVTFLKLDYDREHIEGAQYLWPEWLAPNSPEGSYNLPDLSKATALLEGYGVTEKSHIVLYHIRNEVSPTARMFLTLENLGFRGRVSFLNGGMEAWKKESLPVTNAVPVARKGKVRLTAGDLIVNKEYVLKSLKSESGTVVDARMKNYYDGDPTGNPRDGHITGAKNLPYTEMVDATNRFKTTEELQNYFREVAPPEKELVTYCFIGQTASVVYMAGRLLGYNMKLYDGSLQEWSRIESLPMEKTVKQ